jgi:GGDEF domain-containing protein
MAISVSVGICTSSASELDSEILVKDADVALYHIKTHGRNGFQVYRADLPRVEIK